jgi:hypothetical protein
MMFELGRFADLPVAAHSADSSQGVLYVGPAH